MVCALGRFDNLVGRSHECDFPEAVAGLPVCTRPAIPVSGDSRQIDRLVKDRVRDALSVYEVFPDVLERLQPTHILTQTQCEVCAVSLKDVEAALAAGLSCQPRVVALHPNSLADVWEDIRRVAGAIGIPDGGAGEVEWLQARLFAISQRALAADAHQTEGCIEWVVPVTGTPQGGSLPGNVARGVQLVGRRGQQSRRKY